jgi:hypothetical protein
MTPAPLVCAALSRIRDEIRRAEATITAVDTDPTRDGWQRGYARGFAAGLRRALTIVVDFLT